MKNNFLKHLIKHPALTTALTGFALLSAQVQADQWQVSTGIAVASVQHAWLDSDTSTSIVPVLSAEYGNWSFIKNGIVSYKAYKTDDLNVSFAINYRDLTYNAAGFLKQNKSTNELFEGYKSPSGDITLSVDGNWKLINMSLQQDISGNSGAMSANLGVQLPIVQSESFMLSAAAGVKWLDKDLVNYSYGISESQSNIEVGRNIYSAESTFNYQLSLSATLMVNKNWNIITTVGYERLDEEISDSPLIEKDYLSSVSFAAVYSF